MCAEVLGLVMLSDYVLLLVLVSSTRLIAWPCSAWALPHNTESVACSIPDGQGDSPPWELHNSSRLPD